MSKKIIKAWSFKSASGNASYQTLLYSDGTTSCDCKGWTRRCKSGQRSCKHVRSVDMQLADQTCASKVNYVRPKLQATGARFFDFQSA